MIDVQGSRPLWWCHPHWASHEDKPLSPAPPWPLNQFLHVVSFLEFCPDVWQRWSVTWELLRVIRQNKPCLLQVALVMVIIAALETVRQMTCQLPTPCSLTSNIWRNCATSIQCSYYKMQIKCVICIIDFLIIPLPNIKTELSLKMFLRIYFNSSVGPVARYKDLIEGWQDGLVGKRSYYVSMRTWIRVPITYKKKKKLDVVMF